MKSEERHRLETNVMAEHLADWIDKLRPYATSVAGILLFVFIAMFAWSYLSSSSASWQSQAWDAYNEAVASPTLPNLEMLRESAAEHPGTKMQQLADITWADGQVWLATRDFLYNKAGVNEALNRATSAYQSILQTSDDPRLQNRARLGLARVYEMRNETDKAIEEYNKVTGGFEEYARERAKHLGDASTKGTLDWLAKAEPPRRPSPTGPGTPGNAPAFSAPDMPLPSPTGKGVPTTGAGEGGSMESFLQGLDLNKEPGRTPGRYGEGEAPPTGEEPAAEKPAATGSAPAGEKAPAEQPKQ